MTQIIQRAARKIAVRRNNRQLREFRVEIDDAGHPAVHVSLHSSERVGAEDLPSDGARELTRLAYLGRSFSASSSMCPPAMAGVYRNRTRPVSVPMFFQACGISRGMKAQVPGPPTVTSSPIMKGIALEPQATSSLSWCRWRGLVVPAGKVSSNIMILSPVSLPSSFSAKERPGVGEVICFPPPAGYDEAFGDVTRR